MKQGDYFLARLQAEKEVEKRKERAKRIWNLIQIMTYCKLYKLGKWDYYRN